MLGPPLWNVLFEEIDDAIRTCAFRVAKFADDLSAYRNFNSAVSNDKIREDLRECQRTTHRWGVFRRVSFDASKEHFCILHKFDCFGETFRLLGTLVDPKLTMEDEIRRIRKKAGPKIKAILNTRAYYNTDGLVQQYKSHVLCLLEQSAVAIYHAAQTHLESLNNLQRKFIHELGVSDEEAFLRHKLAPLELRRDIAALGFLHKIQLGEAHPDFDALFPRDTGWTRSPSVTTRLGARRHGRQFTEYSGNSYYFNQSVFGATKVYNVLPEYVVATTSVEAFQSVLTKDARIACQIGRRDWITMYHGRHYAWR